MNILVMVGTHEQPFERLLNAVGQTIDEETQTNIWIVQRGSGLFLKKSRVESFEYCSTARATELYKWADVVITQASPGIVFAALENLAWPLIIGRQRKFQEHVDDHQLDFALLVESNGWGTRMDSVDEISERLVQISMDLPVLKRDCKNIAERASLNADSFREVFWADIIGRPN